MEPLIRRLDESEILKHLSPVERRLYNSSDPQTQLRVIIESRWVRTIGLIVQAADDLGNPTDKILEG